MVARLKSQPKSLIVMGLAVHLHKRGGAPIKVRSPAGQMDG
jgi:hypothetical protein